MIGQKLSQVLEEIEDAIWEFEELYACKPSYTNEGFRAIVKIFMSALMDKIWELQENESISYETRLSMAEKAGEELKRLIKVYTNIDTKTLYR